MRQLPGSDSQMVPSLYSHLHAAILRTFYSASILTFGTYKIIKNRNRYAFRPPANDYYSPAQTKGIHPSHVASCIHGIYTNRYIFSFAGQLAASHRQIESFMYREYYVKYVSPFFTHFFQLHLQLMYVRGLQNRQRANRFGHNFYSARL